MTTKKRKVARKVPRSEILRQPSIPDLRRELELATHRANEAEARSKHLEGIIPGLVNKIQYDNAISHFASKCEQLTGQIGKLLDAIDPEEQETDGLVSLLRQERWERRQRLGVAPVHDICEALSARHAQDLETIAAFCTELAAQKRGPA